MADELSNPSKFGPRTWILAFLTFLPIVSFLPTFAQTAKSNQPAIYEHINKGTYYCRRRQFAEAINEYELALNLDPSNQVAKEGIALTHLNWGALYVHQNRFDEAIAEFELVLKLDPYNRMAKNNIAFVRQQQARMGKQIPNIPSDPGTRKGAKPTEPPPSAVLLLTPGLKQSTSSKPTTEGESEEAVPQSQAGEGNVAPNTNEADATADAPLQPTSASSGSLEDQLTAIERKIYGQKQSDLTVLKRLEKMEKDTTGQVFTGTIKERIEHLKQSYGL